MIMRTTSSPVATSTAASMIIRDASASRRAARRSPRRPSPSRRRRPRPPLSRRPRARRAAPRRESATTW
jgi:hypothetical protein